jgi:hypothetical protein
MTIDVLVDDPLLRLSADRAARIFRYERSELPWPSLEVVHSLHDQLVKVVLGLPRGEYAILLDLRRAPPRNDAEYEAAIGGYVDTLVRHFKRHAILVRTAVGKLQVTRLERVAGRRAPRVFYDEAEALRHLGYLAGSG